MNGHRVLALAAVLGLSAAGCGATPTDEPPAAVAPTASPSAELSDVPDAPSATGDPDEPAPAAGDGAAPVGARCTLTELRASRGRTTGEAGQRHTVIVWTNDSARPCSMTGFGGIDLLGPPDPMGPTYSLPRAAKTPTRVWLAPGGTAHTTITWLPPQDGPGWTPTKLLITPPDETRSATVPWPGGAVLRQDGATRPGTYFDPVAAGSEG